MDTINRQDAIEAMGKAKWAKERISELPPAQPDIVYCKDCIKYDPEKCRCESDVADILGYGRRWEEDDFCSQWIRRE